MKKICFFVFFLFSLNFVFSDEKIVFFIEKNQKIVYVNNTNYRLVVLTEEDLNNLITKSKFCDVYLEQINYLENDYIPKLKFNYQQEILIWKQSYEGLEISYLNLQKTYNKNLLSSKIYNTAFKITLTVSIIEFSALAVLIPVFIYFK